jgi:rSAM/selenodomain-associated transferase 1
LVSDDNYDINIYFSDEVSNDIVFPNYPKFSQRGEDLGARMKNAFADGFSAEYERIVLIGSDCLEIDESIIQNAFTELKDVDLCLGPADDGGYYLIGMSKLSTAVFEDKPWSQPSLMAETKQTIKELNLTSYFLQQLSDIDNAEDLAKHKDYERFLS